MTRDPYNLMRRRRAAKRASQAESPKGSPCTLLEFVLALLCVMVMLMLVMCGAG